MFGAAVLKIPQITRSVFFRQMNSRGYVKSGYIVLGNPVTVTKVWRHVGDNVL